MQQTSIEWSDYSANLIRYRDAEGHVAWACAKVSPGCANCYSEAIARRYKRGGPFTLAQVRTTKPHFDQWEAKKILGAKKIAGKRMFVGDMTDVFGEWVSDELLDRMFACFALRPDVTFQILTKRAERMREYMASLYREGGRLEQMMRDPESWLGDFDSDTYERLSCLYVLPNVWLGVSCEDQQRADERIPHLLQTPAAVRFLSCEPLLSEIDVTDHLPHWECNFCKWSNATDPNGTGRCPNRCGFISKRGGVDWVIVGGESGPGARPCNVSWIRGIVEQCKAAGVPCFVKQVGAHIIDRNDAGFDAETWTHAEGPENGQPVERRAWPTPIDVEHDIHGFREEYQGADVCVRLRDRKGGDMKEWPADLRVREFPKARP